MKLAKLSLAAIVVAGLATSSFAADNLADAFKNGKVNGELRAWYWDRDTGVANKTTYVAGDAGKGNADIFNTGLILGYVTDSLYGFSMGATMQSNFAAFADKDAKNLFSKDEFGSGAVLSEAYLAYKMKNTTAKIGRQFITTPLVSGSGSRMIKESFEGATIVNTDLPATTLVAGYVSKFGARTTKVTDSAMLGAASDVGGFTKTITTTAGGAIPGTVTFDGAYTAAAINKSITNLTLTAQYALANDVNSAGDIDLYYVEANYILPMSNFKLGFDAMYRGAKVDDAIATTFDGTYTGLRVSLQELAGFGASLAYGTTSKSDDVLAGLGGGPTTYTSTFIRASASVLGMNTDSYRFDVSYDFSKIGVAGLKALASYASAKQDIATDIKYTSYAGGLTYDVAALKGLSLAAQYETQEKQTGSAAGVDTDEIRFMANYKF